MDPRLLGLAVNPALPGALLDRLIAGADPDVLAELAGRPDLTAAQVVALAARDEDAAVRLARSGLLAAADVDPAGQPGAALALLDEGRGLPSWARLLAVDPAVEVREKLAACPGLPSDVVAQLAVDPEIRVVAELALCTTAEVAARLAAHPHAEVRRSVAVNQAAPPAVLAMLLTGEGLPQARWCLVCERATIPFEHDPHCPRPDCALPPGAACDAGHQSTVHAIQWAALANPATPPAPCAAFADHPSLLLRRELACRTDQSAATYARVAEDDMPWTRSTLAANPAIGAALQRRLAEDDGHDVRRSLAHHPRLPLDLLTRLAATGRIGPVLLPRVASASPSEVTELARSASPQVRMLVAQRRDLPDGVRDALAADPDAKVVASVAPHPGLSEAQLRAVLARHGDRVAAAVAANPGAPAALLADLAHRNPPALRALREIARHPNATAPALRVCLTDRRARRSAAGHPALPPSVLTELLDDDDFQVVEAAAAHPALPRAVMARLVAGR
ncbi:hypothetical protein ACIRPK_17340 [Kitasatospora sp. NPDC101801]|uniref:hypothetical protein n=1 Tax=Kitasatospora sp. NPDC101801 TaxID=3364103 RepID=UPI0037FF83C8